MSLYNTRLSPLLSPLCHAIHFCKMHPTNDRVLYCVRCHGRLVQHLRAGQPGAAQVRHVTCRHAGAGDEAADGCELWKMRSSTICLCGRSNCLHQYSSVVLLGQCAVLRWTSVYFILSHVRIDMGNACSSSYSVCMILNV